VKYYTISVTDQELEQLHRVYQYHVVKDDNPYLLFHASHNAIDILAYKTGKVLLQGKEITHELISIKKHLGREDYAAIGSDEVGTGDVFGPIVVCSAYVDVQDIAFLESLNVRDSKNMNDKSIAQIAPKIAKRITHSLLILPPKKYNELASKGYNLNKIKALLHNQGIIKTTSKLDHQVPVILDQFCTPQLYFNYSEKLGIELLKGASKEVDEQLKKVVELKGQPTLAHIAKLNYKNVTKQNFS